MSLEAKINLLRRQNRNLRRLVIVMLGAFDLIVFGLLFWPATDRAPKKEPRGDNPRGITFQADTRPIPGSFWIFASVDQEEIQRIVRNDLNTDPSIVTAVVQYQMKGGPYHFDQIRVKVPDWGLNNKIGLHPDGSPPGITTKVWYSREGLCPRPGKSRFEVIGYREGRSFLITTGEVPVAEPIHRSRNEY